MKMWTSKDGIAPDDVDVIVVLPSPEDVALRTENDAVLHCLPSSSLEKEGHRPAAGRRTLKRQMEDECGDGDGDDFRKRPLTSGEWTTTTTSSSSSSSSSESVSTPPSPRLLARRRRAIAACSSSSTSWNDTTAAAVDPRRSSRLRRGGISVERGPDQATHITVTGASLAVRLESRLERLLSRVEYGILEGGAGCAGTSEIGILNRRLDRFLIQHQRQKKRPLEQMLSDEKQALLDFTYYRQALNVLSRVGQWNFNTFLLDSMTGGRSLPTLLIHLFQYYNLIETFRLDIVKLWKCFVMIEEGYHSNNPYHNAVHATDVTQAMHCFLQETKIGESVTRLEVMTSLLAAVTHDLDHPGVNQPFLVATSNHLAALYKNSSVLENHHWRSAMSCLYQSGVLDHLDTFQWTEVKHQIRSLILATDITRQPEFLCTLRHYLDTDYLDLTDQHSRHFVLQIALKCADICNPCRPWEISIRWSLKVCEEFFLQGDSERRLGLPLTALCDRGGTTVAKIQSGFFRFVVAPLFEEWNRFLQTRLSSTLVANLRRNQAKWASMEAEDTLKKSKAEEEVAENVRVESDPPVGDILLSLPSGPSEKRGSFERRHSVPSSLVHRSALGTRLEGPLPLRAPLLASSSLTSPVVEEEGTSSPFASAIPAQPSRGLLVKQSTFPPVVSCGRASMRPSRAPRELVPDPTRSFRSVEGPRLASSTSSSSSSSTNSGGNGECPGDSKCCSNNGCGTPPSSSGNGDHTASVIEADRKDDDLAKPLFRLKSDSDLLKHYTTKTPSGKNGGHRRAKEKENEDPTGRKTTSSLPPLKGRKGKTHGVSTGHRLMGRRGSAPVGLLLSDVTKGSSRGLAADDNGDKSRRRDSAPILFLGDQLPRKSEHAGPRGGKPGYRRGSLPTDLTFNPTLDALADFIGAGLKRRSSVPADELFGLPSTWGLLESSASTSQSRSDPASFSALLRQSMAAADLPNGLVRSVRSSHLLRQTQSFDAAFMGEMVTGLMAAAAAAKVPPDHQVSNTEFRLSIQNSVFPFRRRGSVPVDACLLALSSEDRSGCIVDDPKCENAMQS